MKPDSTSGTRILSRKNRVFCLLILGLFGTGILPSLCFAAKVELLMDPIALSKLPKDQRIVVDTRPAWKFMLSHIPGAINLNDWWDFTYELDNVKGLLKNDKNFIANKLTPLGFSPEKTIIIYGETDDPWRTDGRFFWMFEYYGFKNVSLLDGGFSNWKKAGMKTESGLQNTTPQPQSALKKVNLNHQVIANKILINKAFMSKNFKIIDNRTRKEFNGATPYGSPRSGHIPNAIHIHWPDFFNSDGTLKPRPALKTLLRKNNIQAEQEIIVYCTGGVRSAMAYFVFRYLGFKVRNYDGSWWDWSRSKYPVELNG
ncbi:MAG: sulfurtransferase [Nitrospinaceae bacterium]|nr:sulfurtransferase [Nitrospinaceae bacterium]MBT6347279.1 sulfurtransferase [Nitrospina sp.]